MTLQLPFVLDTSSDKRITFEIIALLIGKKPSKPSGRPKKKPCVQWVKKPPKLDEKTRRKTRGSINEKPPKLNKETRRKTNHLYLLVVKNL